MGGLVSDTTGSIDAERNRVGAFHSLEEIDVGSGVGFNVALAGSLWFNIVWQIGRIGMQDNVVQHGRGQNAVIPNTCHQTWKCLPDAVHKRRGPLQKQIRESLGMGSCVSAHMQHKGR